jgi:hypothetical protein
MKDSTVASQVQEGPLLAISGQIHHTALSLLCSVQAASAAARGDCAELLKPDAQQHYVSCYVVSGMRRSPRATRRQSGCAGHRTHRQR